MPTTNRGKRRRTGARIGALIAVAALCSATLTACFGGGDVPLKVDVETVDVAPILEQPERRAAIGAVLPAVDGIPFAAGGSVQEPGGPSRPAIWVSDDARKWTEATIEEVDGSFSGFLTGGADLAALIGTIWHDGERTATVWTSADRQDWTTIELPAGFAARYRPVTGVVDGTTLYVAGTDIDGKAALLVIGDEASVRELPEVADGETLSPIALAGTGDQLVLLAEPGPEGTSSPIIAHVSDDGGQTWSQGATVADNRSWAAGMVWTASGYVVTGSVRASDDPGAPEVFAAWSSPDGAEWASEPIPAPKSDYTELRGADAWLGDPQAGPDGSVAAVGSNDNAAVSALYSRDAEGTWRYVADTGVNDGNGFGGHAVPDGDGRLVVALSGEGAARLGVAAPGWTDALKVSSVENPWVVADIHAGPEGSLLPVRRSVFTVTGDLRWRNQTQTQLTSFQAGAVTTADWEPAQVADMLGVRVGIDGDEQVVTGTAWSGDTDILLRGWHRASPDADWTPVTGFPKSGATSVHQIIRIDGTWYAVGGLRERRTVGTPSHGAIWNSADGISWSPATGDFGSGALATGIGGVCAADDGTPTAVGWTETDDATFRPVVWRMAGDGTWVREDIGELGNRPGHLSGCASGADGAIAEATLGNRSVLLLDGGDGWEEVFEAGRGNRLSGPIAVPGGYAAAGSWADGNRSGPVVWLSADGTAWHPVAIPSWADGATDLVGLAGDDLLVTSSPLDGDPVHLIPDIAEVIEALPG